MAAVEVVVEVCGGCCRGGLLAAARSRARRAGAGARAMRPLVSRRALAAAVLGALGPITLDSFLPS